MAETQAIVQYEASDGSKVRLSPAIVAKYIVTGGQQVDDREIMAFMAKCQARHLNPLAGDAYMTTYRDKRGNVNASVIVSKDYFVRTATQQPGFDGMRAGVVVASKRDGILTYREGSIVGQNSETLVGGWAEVYDKGRSHPSRAEVSLAEYDQHRSLWNTKPATMIRKVALVQALREAYPGAFGGVYDSAEMPEPEGVQVEATVTGPSPDPAPAQQVEPAATEVEPAWLDAQAARLVALGYDEGQTRQYLSAVLAQQGQQAAQAAADGMAAQVERPQDDAQAVEAEYEDVEL